MSVGCNEVVLTEEEMLAAAMVGVRRLIASMGDNLANVADCKRNWTDEIEGALAEAAVAKRLNCYFDPNLGKFKAKDVGDMHVRHTTLENGSLIIRKRDPEGKYILVTGTLGKYKINGSMDAKKARNLNQFVRAPNGRPPAWFIPQHALEPIEKE